MAQKLKGQQEDANGKCQCERCGKRISQINFYTYKDGSKCEICKPCLTAHIDNFVLKKWMFLIFLLNGMF